MSECVINRIILALSFLDIIRPAVILDKADPGILVHLAAISQVVFIFKWEWGDGNPIINSVLR